jgi:GNAT superfamily N-acetyltransferase
MAPADNWSKVFRPAGNVVERSTEVRVAPVTTGDAPVVAGITCASFGMPPFVGPWIAALVGRPGWHFHVASVDGEPVASAALFVKDDTGWLGVAGTLPSARRRGAQGALMAARLQHGAALGCRWFVTETGQDRPERPNPSFHNMLRAGFQVAYPRRNYLPGATP